MKMIVKTGPKWPLWSQEWLFQIQVFIERRKGPQSPISSSRRYCVAVVDVDAVDSLGIHAVRSRTCSSFSFFAFFLFLVPQADFRVSWLRSRKLLFVLRNIFAVASLVLTRYLLMSIVVWTGGTTSSESPYLGLHTKAFNNVMKWLFALATFWLFSI